MNGVLVDVARSFRSLWRTPGFTITAIFALTLGIGANSSIFSVVNAVLLRPVPYPFADRLVILGYTFDGREVRAASPAKFVVWQQYGRAVEKISALRFRTVNRSDSPIPESLSAAYVSRDFFSLIGAQFELGRPFSADEDRPRGGRVVILSHREWEERFGANRNVLGTSLSLGGQTFDIIGVLGPNVDTSILSASPRVWLPIQIDPATTEQPPSLRILARLRPGITTEQAQQDAGAASVAFRSRFPQALKARDKLLVEPLQEVLLSGVRPWLFALFGAVGLVLLIACANVANLTLVRASVRQREFAVRAALGASRWRIARELLTESLLLTGIAGILALVLGLVLSRTLVALYPGVIPRIADDTAGISMDWRVMTFMAAISIVTAIAFGVMPSIQASRLNLGRTLTETSAGAGASRASRRMRSTLVATEMVLACVLLIGAGLLIRAFVTMYTLDRGFSADGVLVMRAPLPSDRTAGTSDVAAVIEQGIERVKAIPGVASVAATCCAPFESDWLTAVSIVGRSQEAVSSTISYRIVSSGYFDALAIKVLRGRAFSFQDDSRNRPVAIINRAMADRFWPAGDPLRDSVIAFPGNRPDDEPQREIVGIVENVSDGDPLLGRWPPTIYIPVGQLLDRESIRLARDAPLVWIVRSLGSTVVAGEAARALRESMNGRAPVRVESLSDLLTRSVAPMSFNMILLALFGGAALLLAMTGVYGVTAYAIQQRTREIALRMALGATPGRLQTSIFLQGLRLVAASVVIGLAAAFVLGRVLQGTFLGVSTAAPIVFALGPLVMACAAAAAMWLPTWRATEAPPMTVLRS
jgi:putative ABC transport system permease protein